MLDQILLLFSLIIFLLSIYLYFTKEPQKKIFESNFFIIILLSGSLFLLLFFNYFLFDQFFSYFYPKSFYYRFYYYSYSKFKFFYENLKLYSIKTWNKLNFNNNNNFLNSVQNFFYEALVFSAKIIIGIINFAIDTFAKANNYLIGKKYNETRQLNSTYGSNL